MTDPAHELLAEIRDELRRSRLLEESRARIEDGTPLSRTEVCRILHIDLRSTLLPLIGKKLIKTVPWTKGESRIPVTELRRLQKEGLPIVAMKRPIVPAAGMRTSAPNGKAAAEGIRGLKIE